jgi:hypothetical protein
MKRAATITLLCMGAGAYFVADAVESFCVPVVDKDKADWSDASDSKAPSSTTSCRSSSGYYSHFSSTHSSSGYGVASMGVARGGFGGAGHHSGS